MAGVMRRLLTKARPAYNYAKWYSVSVRMNRRMKTCPWSLTRINQNDARADTDNQPSACLESRHNSQRIKSRAKKKERKKTLAYWGSITLHTLVLCPWRCPVLPRLPVSSLRAVPPVGHRYLALDKGHFPPPSWVACRD